MSSTLLRRTNAVPDRQVGRAGEAPVRINTRELFGDAREVLIEHDNQTYRLRITRQNRLILNK